MILDRAAGVLVGAAVGDALGVPYEYGSRRLEPPARMLGGYAPGQWSDDTEMTVCVAQVAATGVDLRDALDDVARGFLRWYADDPADIGVQTRTVLSRVGPAPARPAAALTAAAAALHAQTGRTAGNGSLMRTAPVALAQLRDPDACAEAARSVSALTHADPVAGDACVLWCLAIAHAVRTGELDARVGLDRVESSWARLLDEAEAREPSDFPRNGWVVHALQAAWSAVSRATAYDDGVQRAVAAGGDTDTVAAIAGALLGARYGVSGIPARYRRRVHGWPGLRARDLVSLAVLAANRGRPDRQGWPIGAHLHYGRTRRDVVPHPDDDGVLLGGVGALRPGVADAVVSLCRLGADDVPLAGVAPEDHVEVWLVDAEDANLDPSGVIEDAAQIVRELREEGRTVLLHCVHAHTRTPVVGAAYGALVTGSSRAEALDRVCAVLPSAAPRPSIVAALVSADGP